MTGTGAHPAGLPVLARLRPSRRARRLGRGMALLAALAAAGAAWLMLAGHPWAAVAVPLAGLGPLLAARIARHRAPPAFRAVAVDAGGNWMLQGADGWHDFTPRRIWRSPLGWMTLQGTLGAAPGAGRRGWRAVLTLWSDGVAPADWRRLRIAAVWMEQRGQGLAVPPQARIAHPGRQA